MEELVKYMRALVYLQLQSAAGTSTFGKPELLLSRAGFSHKEIADILGKTPGAIAKAVGRAKKAQAEDANDEQ